MPRPTGLRGRSVVDLYHNNLLPANMRLPYLPHLEIQREFWGQLLGDVNNGWLEEYHIEAWVRMMLSSRSANADWTVISPEFWGRVVLGHLDDAAQHADGSMTQTHSYPAWTSNITRVLIPINIQGSHWFVGEYSFEDMVLTVYNSYRVEALEERVHAAMIQFKNAMPYILSSIGESARASQTARHFRWRYADNVPQQTGAQGDCGPFTCLFLSDRANGQNPNMNVDIMVWRREMANTLWMLTGNQLNF